MFDDINSKREALVVSILGITFLIIGVYMLKNEMSFNILSLNFDGKGLVFVSFITLLAPIFYFWKNKLKQDVK